MNDAAAETLLEALASRLTWTQESEQRWDSQSIDIQCFYTIMAKPGRRARFSTHLMAHGDIDWNPDFFTSLFEAKAACERHLVTGSWEKEPLDITRFSLTESVSDESGEPPFRWEVWHRIGEQAMEMHYLRASGETADDAKVSLTELLLDRGWSRRNIADFFAEARGKTPF